MVVQILIASPGDVREERALFRETVYAWTSLHGKETGLVLSPLTWEDDSWPEIGQEPQQVINRQLMEKSDMVVAAFWTRLGTPTSSAESGTVEEIEKAVEASKPVLVYFSQRPVVPESIDAQEYARLIAWREELKRRALYSGYSDLPNLQNQFFADLTRVIRDRFRGSATSAKDLAAGTRPKVNLLARVARESYLAGNQPSTRWSIIVANRGSATAENVTLELEASDDSADELPNLINAGKPVKALAPGSEIPYLVVPYLGVSPQFEVIMQWDEEGQHNKVSQTLRLF